jgi:uncharacterized protein
MENRFRPWVGLGRVLLFFIACAALLATIAPIERQIPLLPPGLFTAAAASLATLVLTAAFVRWEGLRLEDVGAAISRKSPLRFGIGFLLGFLLVAAHVSIEAFAGHVRWVRSEGVGLPEIATSMIVYVLLSCREELAFRGYPLRRLYSLFGLVSAQLIVALVFAVEHVAGGSTWENALFGAGVGSLLFGMAAIATRGLALPIGLHSAWNLGDWMHGGKDMSGLWRPVIVEGFQSRADRAGMIGYVVVMLAATLGFWCWHRKATGAGR